MINIEFPLCSARIGARVDKASFIFDIGGFDVSKAFKKTCIGFLKTITVIGQNYHPETLGQLFIINAPFIFKGLWMIIS